VHLEDRSACGFVFDDFSAQGLLTALVRAHELHARPEVWKTVQINAMKLRFDWQVAATQYLALYRSLKPHAL
jgi:starch synthase